jgi:hypothetical protein
MLGYVSTDPGGEASCPGAEAIDPTESEQAQFATVVARVDVVEAMIVNVAEQG